jgi:hypothetical protein
MEQAIVVSFESDKDLTELSVRPIDIIRDMIEDAESLGHQIDYCVERDLPTQAAISYDCFAIGLPRGCQHGLIFRAISPSIENHASSIKALLAFATGEIDDISIDFMDSNGKVPLALIDLVESSCSFKEDDLQVTVNVERGDGNIVRYVSSDDPEEDEDEVFFHPYNSNSLLTVPSFVRGIKPGMKLSPSIKTVTVQSGDYILWVGQSLYIPYRKITDLHAKQECQRVSV